MTEPSPKRIVVADDEVDIRRLIGFTLRRRGYEIHEASDGEEALALVREVRPHLVMLDVMMPNMGGLEAARRLSEDPSTASIPVVILSANGQNAEVEAGMAVGARAYLIKPFIPSELASEIARIIADS